MNGPREARPDRKRLRDKPFKSLIGAICVPEKIKYRWWVRWVIEKSSKVTLGREESEDWGSEGGRLRKETTREKTGNLRISACTRRNTPRRLFAAACAEWALFWRRWWVCSAERAGAPRVKGKGLERCSRRWRHDGAGERRLTRAIARGEGAVCEIRKIFKWINISGNVGQKSKSKILIQFAWDSHLALNIKRN